MAIEVKDIEHLAGLARISVSVDEQKKLRDDLEGILAYVSHIKEATAELGEPMAGELRNVLRDDVLPHAPGLFTEDILSGVPARRDNRILVKKIL